MRMGRGGGSTCEWGVRAFAGREELCEVVKKGKALESTANRDEIELKEGETVGFGDRIQLQHVLTGKFVR